jgi:uncharacterized protein YfaS (alpha-2-macroglobulin family)
MDRFLLIQKIFNQSRLGINAHIVHAREWIRSPEHKKVAVGIGALFSLVLIALGVKLFVGGTSFFAPTNAYTAVYSLVNDKISEHGGIVVHLPSSMSRIDAEKHVAFVPAIAGAWVTSTLPEALVYKPNAALELGKHYMVSLMGTSSVIKKDFVVDEDPRVVSIFPDTAAEADRASAITIVFNRPMVPLTTLSVLDNASIPVTIAPATPGRWKWISTRVLQFIPQTTLRGSSAYSVRVRADLVSMDGLTIPALEHTFTTKKLRLDRTTTDTIHYNEPIQFYFNQPVDLAETQKQITLTNNTTHTGVAFVAHYGTASVWDEKSSRTIDVEDRSIISIVPANALRGHANVWDFENNYTASITSAYALGGTIPLAGTVASPVASATVSVSSVIQQVTAQSEKTELASTDLFDPAGTVTFSFYEGIDKDKSTIQVKGLRTSVYGKKCKPTDDSEQPSSDTCAKVDDTSTLIMTFDPSAYARGEKVPVVFDQLVNTEGYQINPTPITTTLSVYPQLRIIRSDPASERSNSNASISDLTLCTNVPLKSQEAKDFYHNFHANKYMVFGRWDNAYLRYNGDPVCQSGEYVNRISYGLLPLESYTINASVEDVFGQKATANLSLHTESAPQFYLRFQNLQKIYNVTTPEHTTLTFATENFDYVHMHLCRVSPETMLRALARSPSDVSTVPTSASTCLESITKDIPLKNAQWVNQYFQVNIKDYVSDPRGEYILSFSHPLYQDEKGVPLYARTYLSVTNLAVVHNHVNWTSTSALSGAPLDPNDVRGSVYWLSRIHSLVPEVAAKIAVYQMSDATNPSAPLTLARTATTDANGTSEFPLIADIAGTTITSGADTAIVSSWADTLEEGAGGQAYQYEKVYLYTDRPIYRPQQTVFIKGLYRVDFDGIFKILKSNDIHIHVSDSKGNAVLDQKVPLSAYGTFASSVVLPADAPLGTYTISMGNQESYFDVQEYVGSAFETSALSDKEEYTAGDIAHLALSGTYYFGAPVDSGTLEYSITSQNYYFDRYSDEYFNFGNNWYDCYDCGYGDTYIKSGHTTLDSSGKSTLDLPLDFNTLYKDKDRADSKIVVLHGTIKNKQGKSVSFQKSFIVHRGDYYLGVKADPSFTSAKTPFNLRVKTVDVAGKPHGESSIAVTISKVDWQSYKRQEVDGGFYNRPERTLKAVATKRISTNASGDYRESMTLPDPGEYQIDARGEDGRGNAIQSSSEIYIYGEGAVSVQPTNNATLNLTAEKRDVEVGETAKFIIQNPYPHAKALISIERGRIFTYEVVDIDQSIYEYHFPITSDYVPNIYASVTLLSPGPEVKFGRVQFTVGRAQKKLTITTTTNKRSYLPGEKVDLTVTTTNPEGTGVPAEVSVAVADLSVLALKGNPKKDPLLFFYDGFPLAVTAETNIKNLLEESPIPTGTKGGDGGSPADLATRKRGEFKDTAFWQSDVTTDAQGVAHVSFTLPDNLTKWQIESLGITKDTLLGVDYHEMVAQKDVMMVPLRPRFIIPGDAFTIGAQVFNQTTEAQTLTVGLESSTLHIKGAQRVEKSIKAGETATVYFNVVAPVGKIDGVHLFTLSAKNAHYNDTVDQALPITRNTTYEYTATAGSTDATSTHESLYLPGNVIRDRGGLTVKTSATLAVYLSDALTYLFAYPYGCSEQLASKLSAIAITKRALDVPHMSASTTAPSVQFNGTTYTLKQAVTIGTAQLYDNQTVDGGFSYYKGLPPDPYLTMHVVNALVDIKSAGYPVRADVIARAVHYLYGEVSYFHMHNNTDALIILGYTLSRVDSSASLSALMNDITTRATTVYMSDAASSETLAYLALLTVQAHSAGAFKERVFATLINRVDIDSRGAYLKTNQHTINWSFYETPQKNTALFLKALVADKRTYAETSNIIRWLVASRSADGSWGSTNTSVSALDALSEYLVWKRETESSFVLRTELDGHTLSSTDFTSTNILSTPSTFVPLGNIMPETMHTLAFTKTNNNTLPNAFYYDLSLKYYLPVENIAPRDEGVAITRELYALTDPKNTTPLTHAKVGEVLRGVVTIISPKERHLFAIEDYIPAGFELVNFSLATEDQSQIDTAGTPPTSSTPPPPARRMLASSASYNDTFSFGHFVSTIWNRMGYLWGGTSAVVSDFNTYAESSALVYQSLRPDFQELRDDRLFLFAQDVPAGTYRYEYYIRATTAGTFSHLPAVASDLYFPENFGRTAGSLFTVDQ